MKIFLIYQLALFLIVCSICSVRSQNKSVGSGFFNIFKGDFWKKGTDAPLSKMPSAQSTKFFERFNNWINKFKGVISKVPARTATASPTEAERITYRVSLTRSTPPPRHSKTWATYSFEAKDDYYDSDSVTKKKRILPRSFRVSQFYYTPSKTSANHELADSVFLYDAPGEDESAGFLPHTSRHFTAHRMRHTRPTAHHTTQATRRGEESDFDFASGKAEESADYVPLAKRHTIHSTHSRGHATQKTKESDSDAVFDSEAEWAERGAAVTHRPRHPAVSPSSVHETYHHTARRYVKAKPTPPSYLDYFKTNKETTGVKTLPSTIHSGHSRLDPAVLGPEVRYHYSQMDTQEEPSSFQNSSA